MADLPDFIPDSMVTGGSGDGLPDFIPDSMVTGYEPPKRDLLGADATPTQAAGRSMIGGFGNLLDSLTFGLGTAGVNRANAIIDSLTGDATYSQALDQRIAEMNDYKQAYRDDDLGQVGAIAGDVVGAVKNPLMATNVGSLATAGRVGAGVEAANLLTKLNPIGITRDLSKLSYLGKIGQSTKEGAILSALSGFGNAEGGAENRLKAALDAGITGAKWGGGLGAVAATLGKGAGYLGGKAEDASENALEKAFGIQYGEKLKGIGRAPVYLDDLGNVLPHDQAAAAASIEAPIQQQMELLRKQGLLEDLPNNADKIKAIFVGHQGKIGKELGNLTDAADNALGARKIVPGFNKAQEYVDSFRDTTKAKLQGVLDSIKDDYASEAGTGFKKLTKFTDKVQKETNFDQATAKEITQLKRYAAFDLRNTAETMFDAALPQRAGEFALKNKTFAALANLGKSINKRIAKQEPSILGYLAGGSKPMAIATGALGLLTGDITQAAKLGAYALGGTGLAKGAIAKFPITGSEYLAKGADVLGGLAESPVAAAIPARLASAIIGASKGESVDPSLRSTEGPQRSLQGKGQSLTGKNAAPTSSRDSSSSSIDRQLLDQIQRDAEPGIAPWRRNASFHIDSALNRAENIMAGKAPAVPQVVSAKRLQNLTPTDINDLAPNLVRAVTSVESAGNPKAVSAKGAQGLMQVMPATAKEIAAELGVKKYDLSDPETNLRFGAHYLQKMLGLFDGDLELALTAYNQGPNRVKNLLKITGGKSFEDIKDRLGPDGKQYAAKVIARLKKLGTVEA